MPFLPCIHLFCLASIISALLAPRTLLSDAFRLRPLLLRGSLLLMMCARHTFLPLTLFTLPGAGPGATAAQALRRGARLPATFLQREWQSKPLVRGEVLLF